MNRETNHARDYQARHEVHASNQHAGGMIGPTPDWWDEQVAAARRRQQWVKILSAAAVCLAAAIILIVGFWK